MRNVFRCIPPPSASSGGLDAISCRLGGVRCAVALVLPVEGCLSRFGSGWEGLRSCRKSFNVRMSASHDGTAMPLSTLIIR